MLSQSVRGSNLDWFRGKLDFTMPPAAGTIGRAVRAARALKICKIIQCNMRDLTERKWAEESLYLEYSRHKRFIDSNIVGVIIATADGKIIEANDYYLTMLGYTRNEFQSGKVDWRAITPTNWYVKRESNQAVARRRNVFAL